MPWLKTNPQVVFLGVAQMNIIEILKFFKNICPGKPPGKVVASEPDTTHVKITYAMKGISRRSQRSRGERQVSLCPDGFSEKKVKLFGDAPYARCEDQFVAHIAGHFPVCFQRSACEKKIAGSGNPYKRLFLDTIRYLLQGFSAHEPIQPGILVKHFFHEIDFSARKGADMRVIARMGKGGVKIQQGKIPVSCRHLQTGKTLGQCAKEPVFSRRKKNVPLGVNGEITLASNCSPLAGRLRGQGRGGCIGQGDAWYPFTDEHRYNGF